MAIIGLGVPKSSVHESASSKIQKLPILEPDSCWLLAGDEGMAKNMEATVSPQAVQGQLKGSMPPLPQKICLLPWSFVRTTLE